MDDWKVPVEQTVSAVWADTLMQREKKPYAGKTTFRASDNSMCARAASYTAAGVEETNPMDEAGSVITFMGSMCHESIQHAWGERFPFAYFETKCQIEDIISGSCDMDLFPQEDAVAEIKTCGVYKQDGSWGFVRSPGRGRPAYIKSNGGPGPARKDVIQAGIYARSLGRENVRIVYIGREAVGVKKALEVGVSSLDRVAQEWLIPKDVWWPMVDNEIERLKEIRDQVAFGVGADRVWPDDNGREILVNPNDIDRFQFPCFYCRFQDRCKADGSGLIELPEVRAKAS